MNTYLMKLGAHSLDSAPEEAKLLLQAAQKQYGTIPNMYGRMAQLPGVLSTYLHGYEAYRKQSMFTPPELEVVLLTISRENGCEYCVAAHSMVAKMMSHVPQDILEAVRSGSPIPDARLQALAAFTKAMLDKRGNPTPDDVEPLLKAGFSEHHILGVILAIAVKTLSNYTNHVFIRRWMRPSGRLTGRSPRRRRDAGATQGNEERICH